MVKYAVLPLLVVSFAVPALAAEFYVAQNPEDKTCPILETKPDGKTMIIVGGPFATVDEAKAAKKAKVAAGECVKRPENP